MMDSIQSFVVVDGQRHDFPSPESISRYLGEPLRSTLAVADCLVAMEFHPRADGWIFAGLSNLGQRTVELFWGLEVFLPQGPGSYTLIPSVWYDGNHSEPTKPIVGWNADNGSRAEIPMSFCATPVALHYDGQGQALVARTSPVTKAGWSGFVLDRAKGTLQMVAPACEARRYRHCSWYDLPRHPYRLDPGASLTQTFLVQQEAAASVADLFRLYVDRHRDVPGYSTESSNPMNLETAAGLVADHFIARHWWESGKGERIFLNAFCEAWDVKPGDETFWPDWWQLTGWCGGPMVSLAMLKRGGDYRRRGLENLDWIASSAIYPCGLPSPLFDGNTGDWLPADRDVGRQWCYHHIRSSGDFLNYMMKCLLLERRNEQDHPAWEAVIRRGLDALCDLFERYGEFGFLVDIRGQRPEMIEPGSCGGAFALQALATAMTIYPEEGRYRKVYREAAAYYHETFVAKGHCTGGPLDILRADDSESAGALADAFTLGWRVLGEADLLSYAEQAARIFSTYVVSYRAPFAPGSPLEGKNPCGGVIANVQNRHIGPGICTNSGVFLRELAQATGNSFYERLYHDIVHAACNFVSAADYDMVGYERDSGAWYPFRRGMVSEQINLGDALNEWGEMWAVSCSWPATSILLSWVEQDGRIAPIQ